MTREGIRAMQDEMAQADARRIDELTAEVERLRREVAGLEAVVRDQKRDNEHLIARLSAATGERQ